VSVEIKTSEDLKGYTIIVGFPGIGVVGPIVAKHIVESSKMPIVGYITSEDFPAVSAGTYHRPLGCACRDRDRITQAEKPVKSFPFIDGFIHHEAQRPRCG
jgi:hypothetical protein